ncbi:MAG: lysoplasmalogenase [Clostridiales bacterium]|nr:lysoplasmalogenase [Clostridiales bacterium]
MTIILLSTAAVFYVLFMTGSKNRLIKTAYKCVPTLCACGLALYLAATRGASINSNLAAAGLFMCAFADAVLEFALVPGAALFGIAHACFILSLILGQSHGLSCAACFLTVFSLLCVFFIRCRKAKPKSAPLWGFVLYAMLLSLMASLAFDSGILLALGGILFALSDTILFMRLFGVLSSKLFSWLLMGAYYSALFCIAGGSCI